MKLMATVLLGLPALLLALAACSDDGNTGSAAPEDGGIGGSAGEAGSSSQGGSAGAAQGGASQGGSSQGGASQGGSSQGGASQGGASGDPHEALHQECIDKINALRATKGLPPYERWKEAESCVDQQATDDEQTGTAHGAWSGGKFPSCNGSGQNECPGWGINAIGSCLDAMWAEKDQAGCSGCDACTSQGGCENCDFYGNTSGDVCGHYVNMSAKFFGKAACGFSAKGGWSAINFQ